MLLDCLLFFHCICIIYCIDFSNFALISDCKCVVLYSFAIILLHFLLQYFYFLTWIIFFIYACISLKLASHYHDSDCTDILQVILIQEQLSKNRIIIDTDKKGWWVVPISRSASLFSYLLFLQYHCSLSPYSRITGPVICYYLVYLALQDERLSPPLHMLF